MVLVIMIINKSGLFGFENYTIQTGFYQNRILFNFKDVIRVLDQESVSAKENLNLKSLIEISLIFLSSYFIKIIKRQGSCKINRFTRICAK